LTVKHWVACPSISSGSDPFAHISQPEKYQQFTQLNTIYDAWPLKKFCHDDTFVRNCLNLRLFVAHRRSYPDCARFLRINLS